MEDIIFGIIFAYILSKHSQEEQSVSGKRRILYCRGHALLVLEERITVLRQPHFVLLFLRLEPLPPPQIVDVYDDHDCDEQPYADEE